MQHSLITSMPAFDLAAGDRGPPTWCEQEEQCLDVVIGVGAVELELLGASWSLRGC
jgi:hypothetical protein